MDYHLAIDIGASGGRHILGHSEGGELRLEEMHRFPNAPVALTDGAFVWDVERLFGQIVYGIKKCAEAGKAPRTIGIDTWAVDYVLVGGDGDAIMPAFSYRDGARTAPFTTLPAVNDAELYEVTGIPPHSFNTVYQLLADKAAGRLETAATFLMLPEYFSYRLTGDLRFRKTIEYTNASTTGLLDVHKRDWAFKLIDKLELPRHLFPPVVEPPYTAGRLCVELQAQTGVDAEVVMVASHDTASAVSTVADDVLYISSGTWSLLGIQCAPITTRAALNAGYANEGAAGGKIRFLKNTMGLWMLQSVRHELGDAHSFADLEQCARAAADGANGEKIPIIDVNQPCFLAPVSMIDAIQAECTRSGQKVPEETGDLLQCIYASLAASYRDAVRDLEAITGKCFDTITIIGGGSKDRYLNELTAAATGKCVVTGHAEATALGNLQLQMKL